LSGGSEDIKSVFGGMDRLIQLLLLEHLE